MICSGRGTHDSSPFFTLPRSSPRPLLNGELFFAVMTLIVRPFSFLPVLEAEVDGGPAFANISLCACVLRRQ